MISLINHNSQGSGEQGSVVIKFTQINVDYKSYHYTLWL